MARHSNSGERSGKSGKERGNGAWTWVLSCTGLVAVSGGICLTLAPRISQQGAWFASSLGQAGISGGALLVAGIITLALAIIRNGQAQLIGRTVFLDRITRDISELRKGQKRLADRFGTLHLEMSVLQEANKTLVRASQDQSAIHAAGAQVDATFRLAVSMDQLGARLAGLLEDQRSDIENRLGNLSGSVQQTRQHVDSWLKKQLGDEFEGLLEPEEEVEEDAEPIEFEQDEPSLVLESTSSEEEVEDDIWDLDAAPELPIPDDLGELEILVTLEDEEHEEAPEWSEGADGDEIDLGLLDELDEDGTPITEPEPEPATESPLPRIIKAPLLTGEVESGSVLEDEDTVPEPPSLLSEELTDEVLKEALDTIKRRRGI
jgi:hypothetical protein